MDTENKEIQPQSQCLCGQYARGGQIRPEGFCPEHGSESPASSEAATVQGERESVCPQCGEDLVQPRDSKAYCEECGYPEENRLSSEDYIEMKSRAEKAERERDALKGMGEKVNAIRNSIIGLQSMNWSEHIYPLVATLNESGFKGLDYPEAKANMGTLLEQRDKAERERDEANGQLDLMRDEFKRINSLAQCSVDWSNAEEIKGLCERAIGNISQKVPLIEQRDKAEAERDNLKSSLLGLLCVIHRDGGHYISEQGLEKSLYDAEVIVRSGHDAAEEVAKLTEGLKWFSTSQKHLTYGCSINASPETCVKCRAETLLRAKK
jgi:ribosomal protein L37E